MRVIGLTGSIASGKSLVSNFFREKGVEVIDADVIARIESSKGSAGLNAIAKEFGSGIIDDAGEMNRKKMAELIFSDDIKREKLNSILHPIIKQNIIRNLEELKNKNSDLVVLDIPLLYEAGWKDLADCVIVVYCDDDIRLKRLMKRDDITKDFALKKMRSQMKQEDKIKFADYVIDNSHNIKETKRQFDELFNRISNEQKCR